MDIKFILLFFGAYLLGSVPAAYLAARMSRGVDIRKYGSGNVGGSNLLRVAPKRVAIPAFFFDVAKGWLPVVLAKLVGLSLTWQVIIGLAAIAGHNWPVFLRFNGGRGIATTLGVTLAVMPVVAVILAGLGFAAIPFHIMAVVTILVLWGFPLAAWFSYVTVVNTLLGWSLGPGERFAVALALAGIPIIAIIRRLTAPKTEFTSTVSRFELFFNRLFLDRDIKDGKAWVSRNLDAAGGKK